MLASHADREHVIGALEAAFAAGLLAKDDFNRRVDRALASRTYADLAAVAAGLTAGPCRAGLGRAENAAAWGVCGLIVSAVLAVVVMPAGTTKGVVVGTAVVIYAVGWLLAAVTMIVTRLRSPRR